MLPQPDSSSDKLRALSGETSLDQSSCSSDTGHVLIRSTRVLASDRRHEAGPGPGSVQITVQKLPVLRIQPPVAEQQRPKPRQKLRAAVRCQPGIRDTRTLKKPELTKENREPKQPPAAESSPDRKLSAGTPGDRQPGHDLLTSRFAAGGRGVVLAALKQRSHGATRRREVKVQLLDPGPAQTSSQDAVGVASVRSEAGSSAGRPEDDADAAAAAHPIKAPSGLEARVSRLADGVQTLLRAHREDGDRGRSLSQQTLHHLETLHSHQLQLQNQLWESALRIMTGHAAVTHMTSDPAVTPDLTPSGQPAHLQVTHLDTADVLSNQRRSSSATVAAAAETGRVAIATPRRARRPEQTREDRYRRDAPSVSTATQPAAGSHLQSSTYHNQAAATRGTEVLREIGRLKTEMEMLLTPDDSLKTSRPEPDHHLSQQHLLQSQQSYSQQIQSQQNLLQPTHFQSKSQQSKSQQTEPQQSTSQQNQAQSQQVQSPQTHSQSHQSPFPQVQFQENQTHPAQSQQSQSVQVQRRPPVPSLLEEAGRVLRQVQRQKKVLEENLDALLRVRTGEVLHCQLEALAANRDLAEEVRIKKTVDAWINAFTGDTQVEMSSEDPATKHSAGRNATVTSQQRAAGSSTHRGRGRPMSTLRGPGSRGQTAGHRRLQGAEPERPTGGLKDREQVEVDGESYLTRLYGRAPYEGQRRTLKKSPYLRFSSPSSPLSLKPRPRLVESVRGVKVKSCKTQTCVDPPLSQSPGPPEGHCIISSSHLTSGDLVGGYSVPMAIPLGRPRMDSSRCLTEHQQEVTSPPAAPPTSSMVAMDDGAELLSHKEEQLDADEAPPLPRVDIIKRKNEEEEDEESVFPGADFLSVADSVQQEEVSVVGEEAVELDGGPSPPPVLYQGPVFPPQAPSALPERVQASALGLNLHTDVLENRLVEWVEQQLMSRIISAIYRPPPSDPAQDDSTDQSEPEEQSVTSDIVEAAGGGGLQLFVDSSTSVDSALIRQLVDEVLTEHVALMLGHRDPLETGPEPGLELPKPGPGAHHEERLVSLVPTPVPTPSTSPTQPSRETPPLTTPPASEPTSLLNEEFPQPITAPETVATPTPSPEPAHSAGSPPAVLRAPPPLTWGDAELPLDEERPEEHLDTHPQPLVMSVAEADPPLSSPLLPPPSIPPAISPSPPPPGPEPRPVSTCSSSEDSSSSSSSGSSGSSSSNVVTADTDGALKHISEGELLLSVNQRAAMTEEEVVCSLSSSLQELQDMDFDPPSEGQVRGHDLLLTLLSKMEQGVTHTHRGERPQPEGSWGGNQEEGEVSVGEVRDNQTTNPNSKRAAARRGETSSPGQISQCAGVSEEVSHEAANQGSLTVGDLMGDPIGTLTSDLQTDLSLSPPPPPHLEDTQVVAVQVRQYDTQTAGTRRMDVHLPPIRPDQEQEEVMEEVREEVMEE
ncbi:protein TALPID3 isoform X2 [Chelmon rostratus]|uniref:protein TALPID3 isoform X2 n=1 Tax=Chelmon rostratus TaxID=109905 RepID=UPI001BE6E60D|nr:protein TALPID3 isoform X2 [Chelmon rostratus]